MTIFERSDIMTALYRLQCDLNVLGMKCADAKALVAGAKVVAALAAVNDALEEFQPDSPAPLNFPDSRY